MKSLKTHIRKIKKNQTKVEPKNGILIAKVILNIFSVLPLLAENCRNKLKFKKNFAQKRFSLISERETDQRPVTSKCSP
jgi:hypothetical protein